MINSITAFFMGILIALMSFFSLPVPEVKTSEELSVLADICKEYPVSGTVYVLNPATFETVGHRNMATALQGLVAKESPQIYILSCSLDDTYLNEMKNSGIELSYEDENGDKWTLETLLEKFGSYITDSGYVLYRQTDNGEGINTATNYAAMNGWLPVPEELESIAIDAGLTMKKDISDDEYDVYYQWKFFEKYKKNFSDRAVCHINGNINALRDLAIQQGFYVFYIDDDTDNLKFRKRVLEYYGDNTHVLGWVKYEVDFVNQASEAGNMISPSDYSHNNSLLASFNCEIPVHKAEKSVYTDETKHYVALVMSDGDNMQWIQNGYKEYFEKLSLSKNFPVTWSFSPMLQDFSPVTVKTVYEAASDKDYFMSGVSGAGYMHPTQYPKKALAGFTDITSAAMAKSGLQYVQILDSTPKNELDEYKLISSLEYYARYDNIKGGIISLDPDRYAGGKGSIYFADDKPFMTYRLSLWHPSGEMGNVTKEWLDEQAAEVNSYSADIHSINGYSAINIHPWTISVESLSYFVSKLDDDIVLVTVEELMEMIKTNIPHEN